MTEKELEELDVVGTGQAAKMLSCHHDTIRKWIKSGKIRAWRVAGRWLVSKTELLEQFELYECESESLRKEKS